MRALLLLFARNIFPKRILATDCRTSLDSEVPHIVESVDIGAQVGERFHDYDVITRHIYRTFTNLLNARDHIYFVVWMIYSSIFGFLFGGYVLLRG